MLWPPIFINLFISSKRSLAFILYIVFLQLLDYEAKAGEQVPLLMKMGKGMAALNKAIESGDTDLGKTREDLQ